MQKEKGILFDPGRVKRAKPSSVIEIFRRVTNGDIIRNSGTVGGRRFAHSERRIELSRVRRLRKRSGFNEFARYRNVIRLRRAARDRD